MKLIFTYEEFRKKFYSIKDKKKRLKWAEDLREELVNIYRNYTDEQYAELYEKYDLSKLNEYIQKQTYFPTDNQRIQKSDFKYFILYLEEFFITSVNKHIFKLNYEFHLASERKYYNQENLPDEKKFPLFDYNLIKIQNHCDYVLFELRNKIRYYDYVLRMYTHDFEGREAYIYLVGGNIKRTISIVKRDLESLKLKYELEKDRRHISQKLGRSKKSKKLKSDHSENISIIQKYDKDKLVWLGSKNQLIKLLHELQEYDFIRNNLEKDPDCEKMLSHFVDKDNKPFTNIKSSAKIRLVKKISDLLYLYANIAFVTNKLLSDDLIWIKTEKIFIKRDGSKLNNKNLSASYHLLSDMERPTLDSIINGVLKLNSSPIVISFL